MRANGPAIYTLAIRLSGNASDGADLAQDTFLTAWKHWGDFRGDSAAGTWFYRICLNLWKNRVRYEKRRSFWRHFSLDGAGDSEDEERVLQFPDGAPPIDAPLERSERQQQVQEALNRLDPEDREMIVLREMEERSYEDIAALLQCPIGTVKSRLARARTRLTRAFHAGKGVR